MFRAELLPHAQLNSRQRECLDRVVAGSSPVLISRWRDQRWHLEVALGFGKDQAEQELDRIEQFNRP